MYMRSVMRGDICIDFVAAELNVSLFGFFASGYYNVTCQSGTQPTGRKKERKKERKMHGL